MHIDLTEIEENKKVRREQRYWIKEFGLFVSDRLSLVSGDWLTDGIINCAQRLLKERYPLMGGLQHTSLGDTLSYTIERGEFIQIINIRGNHWVTVSNIGSQPNCYNIYDSMCYGDLSSRAKKQICALIFSDSNEITLNFPSVQLQKGASDCGLFSVAYATTLCTGFDPVDLKYNQEFFRTHLFECIQKKFITPFPCEMLTKKRQPQNIVQVVPLHCVCRQPEEGRMAQCDMCGRWYHEECVKLPDNVENIEWFCARCKQ